MANFKTHLTVLADAAAEHPTTLAFQLPILTPEGDRVQRWQPVTYKEFQSDVEHFANYWNNVLASDGIAPRSVIGVW